MNSFTLDDIDDLILNRKSRLDETGEYDISYYEKLINENVILIGRLILEVQQCIEKMKSPKNKKTMANLTKDLISVYNVFARSNVREEYNNDNSHSLTASYFVNHPYAKFIERDFQRKFDSFSDIIKFMKKVYNFNEALEKKSDVDSDLFWEVFKKTKDTCNNLGIRCPDAFTLYEAISKGLVDDDFVSENMTVTVDEDNALEHDVLIDSLPYSVSAPYFTTEGAFKYEMSVAYPSANVWYNKSYLEKQRGSNLK